MRMGYRRGVAAAAKQSAAAYGYTISVWGGGAALIHQEGTPPLGAITLFVIGAVVAFALVETYATQGFKDVPEVSRESGAVAVAGALHVVSAGAAVGCAMLIGVVFGGLLVWPLAAFGITVLYVLLTGAEVVVGERRR